MSSLPIKTEVRGVVISGEVSVDLLEIINQYDWDAKFARKIIVCESRNNPNAHNFSDKTKDDSWGLFQINRYGELAKNRPSSEWLLIPENNVAYAYFLYQKKGWQPWKKCLTNIGL